MSKTTRIATCPFADTYENLRDDNPILRNGQRVYDTKNKQWYTGDGITAFNDLTPDDGEIDLSGYQTIENSSDNYRNEGPSPDNAYLSISGAQAMYDELQGFIGGNTKSEEEIIEIVNNPDKNYKMAEQNSINEVISSSSVVKNYKNLTEFFEMYETWADNGDLQLSAEMGKQYAPTGSIINIESGIIPRLIVSETIPGFDPSANAIYFENEEVTAAVINEKLEQDRYFYTKYTKFEKLCNGQGGSLISQEELERLNYYGDKNIIPTSNDYFTFYEDENYITLNKNVPNNVVIPYKKINGDIITAIEYSGYSHNNVETMILPNSIVSLGIEAFMSESFTKIILSKNLKMINTNAFMGCENLSEIIIPQTVTKIMDEAFSDCVSLSKVYILNDNVLIFSGAFTNCSSELTLICNPGSTAENYAKANGIKYAYNYVKSEDLGGSSADLSGYQTIENMMTSNDFLDPIAEKTDDKYVSAKAVYEGINEVNSRIDNLDNQSDIEDLKNNTTFGQNAYSEGENSTEGIAIGYNAMTGVNGVAIGPDACNKGTLENGMPYYTSAIQLGRGTNPNDGTFQVYNYQLLDANGKIPAERLPEGIGGDSSADLSGYEKTENKLVDTNWSIADMNPDMPNGPEEDEFINSEKYVGVKAAVRWAREAYVVGVEANDIAERLSYKITSEVEPDIEGLKNTYSEQGLEKIHIKDENAEWSRSSIVIGGSGGNSDDFTCIGFHTEGNGVCIGNNAKAKYSAETALEYDGGEAGTPLKAIQIGEGTNNHPDTFQVYNYQLLDANGKIPAERISNMFYLDGDNLKISIGGKTFTLTPDAE